jgi:hypothetical protein
MSALDNLTIGKAKQLATMFAGQSTPSLNCMIGEKVIVRTYSAGVHFGILAEKSGNEVILKDSRRLWQWHAKESISLSGVAVSGIVESNSRIAPAVPAIWLEAIEIIPCGKTAAASIEGAPNAKSQ